jgi:peptidoglycan/LPS O-acetylase OafA/YrhL
VFPLEHPFMHTVGFTCSFIAYGGLLIYCMKCLNGDNPVLTVLAKIGIYSYTIYLVHLPVAFWCVSHGWSSTGFHKTLVFCVYLPMSIAVGILFGKAVELPVLRLREKILPRIDLDGLIVAPVRSPA